MVEFDTSNSKAVVWLSLGNVSFPVSFDLSNIKSEPFLRDSKLRFLDVGYLRSFLEYADSMFNLDVHSQVPWKEQFCSFWARESDRLLSSSLKVSPHELRELKGMIRDIHRSLVRKAMVDQDEFVDAVSYQYHDGFNHMTRDDDFFAVRRGNKIVAIIPLPGNDYNELKKFLMMGSDMVLSPENVADFHKAVLQTRKSRMAKLLRRKGDFISEGLKIVK